MIFILNKEPTQVGILSFIPHDSILYLVWAYQLTSHKVDDMKYCPKLSYLALYRFSYLASMIYYDYLHFNKNILLFWASIVVTRDPAVDDS